MAKQDVLSHLLELTTDAGAARDISQQAAALAELQRASASALRGTVVAAREQGMSWRELAGVLQMAAPTLYSQFRSGRDVVAVPQHGSSGPDADPGVPVGTAGEAGPPPQSLPTAARPGPPTAGADLFVGRQQELADLRRMLARSRMVTLVGTGGVGKTRLAAELVPGVRKSYPGGVWWSDLAPLVATAQVEAAVAAAVRASASDEPTTPRTLVAAVSGSCAAGATLLVLDNCEHLVGACADLISSLLAECPRLRVLATSREGLGIPGESLFAVAPLSIAPDRPLAATEARSLDSVRLFADRARAVCPGFELTDDRIPVVARLCAELDGLPLAIELAARLSDMFTPSQMLDQLDDRLTLLTGRRRDLAPRHRSLRAAIEWSYDLLNSDEQAVFRRLAVLPGGFNRDTAAGVCADLTLSAVELWCVLTSLHGKSLLVAETTGRLRILESLRAFGIDRADAAGEVPGIHDRLLAWLSGLAQPLLTDTALHQRIRRPLDEERHNLRYAMQVAKETSDERYPLIALALASVLLWRGDGPDGLNLLEFLLSRIHTGSPVAVVAHGRLAWALARSGDFPGAKRHSEKCIELSDAVTGGATKAYALKNRALVSLIVGDVPAALAAYRERIALFRSKGSVLDVAMCLNQLAWTLTSDGQYEAALEAAEEAITITHRDFEDEPGVFSSAQHTVGTIAYLQGDLAKATVCFTMSMLTPTLDAEDLPSNTEGLALVAARSNAPERALRLLTAGSTIRAQRALAAEPWWQRLLDEAMDTARSQLSPAQATAATAEGAALTVEETHSYALSDQWPGKPRPTAAHTLTAREYQVVSLLVQGLTNSQIGSRLGVTPRTVASHLEHVRTKLDLPTRAQVIAWATREVLESPPGQTATASGGPGKAPRG
ncbi:MAG TPA: LuxR C-terminal-related transcriptional regulator [Streptosporangiaceae bacterium]|nr:LuxR C-terminal-related transcriptional regulator [Streptosporangiaceae bacterium]